MLFLSPTIVLDRQNRKCKEKSLQDLHRVVRTKVLDYNRYVVPMLSTLGDAYIFGIKKSLTKAALTGGTESTTCQSRRMWSFPEPKYKAFCFPLGPKVHFL